MRRLLPAIVLLAACLLAPRGARADNPTSSIQVLAIASDKNFEHAQALTIALKRAVTRAEGWALAKGDYSLEVISLAIGCDIPPSADCQKKIGAKAGAGRYIWGTLSVQKKEAVAELHLFENGAESRSTTVRYPSNLTDPSDDTLLQVAAGGFAELMGATQGVLVVTAGSVSGEVFVDGEKVGLITEGRTELTVAPGEHKVLVRAPGYNDAVGTVNVQPGASAEINLKPTAHSSGGSSDPTQDSGGGMSTNKVIGYGGLAVGGLVAAAGGYFWIQSALDNSDSDWEAFKSRVPESADPCDVAANGGTDINGQDINRNPKITDHCDANKTHKTLALILTPVGAVIAGVGAYFLLTDDSGKKSSKKTTPTVQPLVGFGPQGGEVRLHVSF